MSYENKLASITMEAGGDLSANQYYGVDVASDGQVDVVTTKGAKVLGILQDKPAAAGRAATIGLNNVSKMAIGAAVTAGNEVIVDATGRAIPTDAADQYIVGTALETGTAAGQIIAVRLKMYQRSA